MSETEHRKGKLLEVAVHQYTFEEKLDFIKTHYKVDVDKFIKDGYIDLDDKYIGFIVGFVYVRNKMYKILNDISIDPYHDICIAIKDEDGEINYELKYYNGGTNYDEMLEDALKSIGE
jgi:hypothetical protein